MLFLGFIVSCIFFDLLIDFFLDFFCLGNDVFFINIVCLLVGIKVGIGDCGFFFFFIIFNCFLFLLVCDLVILFIVFVFVFDELESDDIKIDFVFNKGMFLFCILLLVFLGFFLGWGEVEECFFLFLVVCLENDFYVLCDYL